MFFVCLFPTFTKASRLSTPLRRTFPGMFLTSFNNLAGRVLSGYKATRQTEWFYTPIKLSHEFIKHYFNSPVKNSSKLKVPPYRSLTASGSSQIKQTDENTRNDDPEFRLMVKWLLQTVVERNSLNTLQKEN